ncbi:MAG TPA: glycosyltransferase family 2 protein [Myxococcota bacterium]|nr:glycosyltransferase family 2 protein [Myxococcota bacterium]
MPSRGEAEELELTVLMPCLNEAETVGICIEKARNSLELNRICGEVLIADNGCTDGTREIAEQLGARVVRVERRGYGAALLGGIAAARGRFVIMGDADGSYDFANLMPFVDQLRAGYDLVMGNRFRGGIAPGAMRPLHRYLGNPALTALGRLFFKSPAGDFHCGLRGFRREVIHRLGLRTTGMEFASEMVVKATLLGLSITEVPTTLSPDGRSRAPHLRSWRDGWRHLRFLLLFSPRWLFLYPGFASIGTGAALFALILPGPLTVAGATFDVNTLMYASAAVVLGAQSVIFAAFTKVYAVTHGLHPPDPRLDRLFRFVTLETGLLAGALLLLAGAFGTTLALDLWGRHSFGDLDPRSTLRLIIPSTLFIALGFQIILSSFFLSVLGLGIGGEDEPREGAER